MQYYLKMEPHLFRAAMEENLQRIRDENDAEAELKHKQHEEQGPAAKTDSSDLVLYRYCSLLVRCYSALLRLSEYGSWKRMLDCLVNSHDTYCESQVNKMTVRCVSHLR